MGDSRTANPGTVFAEAMAAYEQNRANDARRLARQIVETHPEFGGAHYLLGLLDLDQGHPHRAAEHLARAIAITPDAPVLHLTMAGALELAGETNSAIVHFRTVLAHDPGHAEAHARLGELLRRTGKLDDAIDHCRAAVTANPGHAEARNSLGALLLEAGRAEEAAEHLRHALAARPDWPAALNNYGLALIRLGHLEQAVTIHRGAVELKPGHAGFRSNLAAALRTMGRLDDARSEAEQATRTDPRSVDAWLELGLARQAAGHGEGAAAAFERAVGLSPPSVRAHYCLAEIRRTLGQAGRAAVHYRHCLELDPADHYGAALGLAVVGEGPAPDKAPAAYVRQLFDDTAGRFDTLLVERLDYRAPEVLKSALARTVGPVSGLTVMDAGCGTGLAATVLRPLAARLEGVDLSPGMVAQAAKRGLYDALSVGELVETLAARPAEFDLVVAADVLVYLGDLAPVMKAASVALAPGGYFAFTVERLDDATTFALGPKNRFAHGPAYIRTVCQAAGLSVLALEEAVTRSEGGVDVPGLVVVVRKEV